jgi:hypothetical protein
MRGSPLCAALTVDRQSFVRVTKRRRAFVVTDGNELLIGGNDVVGVRPGSGISNDVTVSHD